SCVALSLRTYPPSIGYALRLNTCQVGASPLTVFVAAIRWEGADQPMAPSMSEASCCQRDTGSEPLMISACAMPQYSQTAPISGMAGMGPDSAPTAAKPAMMGSSDAVSAAADRAGSTVPASKSDSCASSVPRYFTTKSVAATLFCDPAERQKPVTPAKGEATSPVGLGTGSIATSMPASVAAFTCHGPVSQNAAVPSRNACFAMSPSTSVLNTPVPFLPWPASHVANSSPPAFPICRSDAS